MSRISQGSPGRYLQQSPQRDQPLFLLPQEFMNQVNQNRVPNSAQKPTNPNSSAKKQPEPRGSAERIPKPEIHTPTRPFSVQQDEVGRDAAALASQKKLSQQLNALQIKIDWLERENSNLLKNIRSKDDEIANCGKIDAINYSQKKQISDLTNKIKTLTEDNKRLSDINDEQEKEIAKVKEEQSRQKKQNEIETNQLRRQLGSLRETQQGIRRTEIGYLEDEINKLKKTIREQETQIEDLQRQANIKDTYHDGSLSLLLNKRNDEINQLTLKLKESKIKQNDLVSKVDTLLNENSRLQNLANTAFAQKQNGGSDQIKKLKSQHAQDLKALEAQYKQKLQDSTRKASDVDSLKQQLLKEKEQVRKLETELKEAKKAGDPSKKLDYDSRRSDDRKQDPEKQINQLQNQVDKLKQEKAALEQTKPPVQEIQKLNEKLSDNNHLMMQMEIRIKQINQEKEYALQEQQIDHAQQMKALKDDYNQQIQELQQKVNRSEDQTNDKNSSKQIDNQKLAAQMKKLSNEISSQENKIRELLQEREDQYQLFQDQSVELLETKQTVKLLKRKIERLESTNKQEPKTSNPPTQESQNLKGSRSYGAFQQSPGSDAGRLQNDSVRNARGQGSFQQKNNK